MASSRSNARIIRFALFALLLIGCGYILSRGSSYGTDANFGNTGAVPKTPENKQATSGATRGSEGLQAAAGAGSNVLVSQENKDLSKESSKDSTVKGGNSDRVKATFVTLARNSDLGSLLESIRQVEDRFNRNFNYDWVFLNDKEFSDDFKQATTAACSGTTKYGLIPVEHWSYPEWISKEEAALTRERMKNVIYGSSEPYRHMCRYESGFFWRHELMAEYEYYWRVEPDIKIFCDIDYDIFKFMKDNNKKYSFTISLPEYKETIPTLWETTKKFITEHKEYVAENNLMDWISDDKGQTYNGCHFWSNFEIASLDFWRSDAYRAYFDALDHAGGFFYERWGDAPVHSLAVALFLPRDQVHFFDDVGYFHNPFHNCPVDAETRLKKNCVCDPNKDFTWKGYSCTTKFYTLNNMKRPAGWENFSG